ncbi:unnamed protein product [Prorocentrum cordatum]|uniref:Uncharacterized protein n=1 Tax=Prorocentrum cordatum TaxID=2364126 RepID=A0ABN9Y1A8_9DINO|nr:unnamed protein product [Polarella glacialis]
MRGAAVTCGSTANGQAGTGAVEVSGSLWESSSAGSAADRGTRAAATRGAIRAKAPSSREKLAWKATFIDLRDDERQGSLSPRPSSEPCSESSSRFLGLLASPAASLLLAVARSSKPRRETPLCLRSTWKRHGHRTAGRR